jgi:hypothetical protein
LSGILDTNIQSYLLDGINHTGDLNLLWAGRVAKVACGALPGGIIRKSQLCVIENCFTDEPAGIEVRVQLFLDHALADAGTAGVTHQKMFTAGSCFNTLGK